MAWEKFEYARTWITLEEFLELVIRDPLKGREVAKDILETLRKEEAENGNDNDDQVS